MEYDFTANERFSIQTRYVGQERQPVLVVDDFLRDAASMVRYAAEQSHFQPSPLYYPGLVAPAPREYVQALMGSLLPHIGDTFSIKIPTGRLTNSFFGIITFPPEQLQVLQRIPHTDDFYPGLIAILQYFCDPAQGGTAFFRHRATGYESLDEARNRHMGALLQEDYNRNGPFPARYITSDDRLFEQTAGFEAQFNRLLVYRGNLLHSGLINANTRLDPNPRIGRLTTNAFFRFELA